MVTDTGKNTVRTVLQAVAARSLGVQALQNRAFESQLAAYTLPGAFQPRGQFVSDSFIGNNFNLATGNQYFTIGLSSIGGTNEWR